MPLSLSLTAAKACPFQQVGNSNAAAAAAAVAGGRHGGRVAGAGGAGAGGAAVGGRCCLLSTIWYLQFLFLFSLYLAG